MVDYIYLGPHLKPFKNEQHSEAIPKREHLTLPTGDGDLKGTEGNAHFKEGNAHFKEGNAHFKEGNAH